MGVLNVTPDSFSDGGLWIEPRAAIDHARQMVADGAKIIDIGGESTRPGATPVPEDEELRRVLPVIEALASDPGVPISIDTRKPAVARRALEAGAVIVNDTNGEATDGLMTDVCVATGAGVILMHSRGTPDTMRDMTDYGDIVADVCRFLLSWAQRLESAGVASEAIVLDPGFGFAKTPAQNLELLERLDEVVALGYPVLSGTSRKSFIGAVLDLPEDERLEGTAATVAWAVSEGASILRVHDVKEMSRVVKMASAIAAAANEAKAKA
ncbi:MAG: dihydropteroate synthase [Actinomycetota bacterium]|jgi:dihydropteroate synthase|nr:dihydropteroate synthase [Actinomycetota bacterium]